MSRNKVTLLLLNMLVCAEISAQTFEKVIHVSDSADKAWMVEILESNNIVLVGYSENDPVSPSTSVGFAYKFDKKGVLLKNRAITNNDLLPILSNSNQNLIFYRGLYLVKENEIVVNGSIGVAGNGSKSANLFFKMDTTFNLTKIKIDTNKSIPFNNNLKVSPYWYTCYDLNDSSYALMGYVFRISNPNPNYILSDSSRYFEIDKKTLAIKDRQNFYLPQDSIYTMRILNMLEKDSYKYIFASGKNADGSRSNMYMLKVDSLNSILQFSKIDPPRKLYEHGGFMSEPPGLAWLSDTSFLYVTSELTTYPKVWPGNSARHGDVHFLVYDTSFNLIRSKRLEIHDTTNYKETPMLRYDSISNSFYYGFTSNMEITGSLFSGDTSFFRLIRFDKNLNIIWDRSYRKDGRLYMTNIAIDHEGHVIMLGIINEFSNPNEDDLDLYLLKIDSNGNYQKTVSLIKNQINSLHFTIYPNPAKGQLNFQKFNYFMPYKVRLFDTFGREVMRFEWIEDLKTIPIADLAPGVYIYRISDENGRMSSGKIVVE